MSRPHSSPRSSGHARASHFHTAAPRPRSAALAPHTTAPGWRKRSGSRALFWLGPLAAWSGRPAAGQMMAAAQVMATAQVTAVAQATAAAGARRLPAEAAARASDLRHPLGALEWVRVERVVDGDTLIVRRGAERVCVRLRCVDTEERTGHAVDPHRSKPATVFGEDTRLWLEDVLRAGASASASASDGDGDGNGNGNGDAAPRVGLAFGGRPSERDRSGRLLAHVALADGRDLSLLLVRCGRSPYFVKYGRCEVHDRELARAEAEARAKGLGLWNEATNRPLDPEAPRAGSDYGFLTAWWQARARAVDAFRSARSSGPEVVLEARQRTQLRLAARSGRAVRVFGEALRVERRGAGEWRLWLALAEDSDRAGDEGGAVWVDVPERRARRFADFEHLCRAGRQNYVWAAGAAVEREGGLEVRPAADDDLHLAGPEPVWKGAQGQEGPLATSEQRSPAKSERDAEAPR